MLAMVALQFFLVSFTSTSLAIAMSATLRVAANAAMSQRMQRSPPATELWLDLNAYVNLGD